MGYRLAKNILGLSFLLSGLYLAWGGEPQSGPDRWIGILAGLPLCVLGAYFFLRKIQAWNLFRLTICGILAVFAIQLTAGGIFDLIHAVQSETIGASEVTTPIFQVVAALVLLAAAFYALWAQSNIRRVLENIFSIPELLGKLIFTLALLAIYRIGFHVPLPGLNQAALEKMASAQQQGGLFGDAMEYFSMFTGGNLGKSTLFGLGIMPYISASIIFMLLTNVIPSLEKLQKEGAAGQRKIREYTRYAAVGLCVVQATFWMKFMMSPGALGGDSMVYPDYIGSTMIFLCGVVGLTAGTIFLMWLGEQIDEYGIGNGISLLIMAGIVVRLPLAVKELIVGVSQSGMSLTTSGVGIGMEKVVFLCASFVFVVAGAILITQGQRRIPIQQAKQTRGRRTYGGQRHYMPLRVNHGGVMPIIFASSLMIFPGVLTRWLDGRFHNNFTRNLNEVFQTGSFPYTLIYVALIFFFAYFWTTVNFRPKEMSDQLRDMGHFIPGLRPGKRTADYLERVMERITYCGAAFLAVIAVLPTVIATKLGIPFRISAFLGGTGLLIMVSVTLDLVQRIEANLVMRNYGGFLGGSSRIKGAYG